MAKYRRVKKEDRIRIRAYLESGVRKAEIAKRLNLHRATVYREIGREKDCRGYNATRANEKAVIQFSKCRKKKRMIGRLKFWVLAKLAEGWSPEQVCNRLKLENSKYQLSHETIYRFIEADYRDGGKIFRLLRRQKIKNRRRRFPKLLRQPLGKSIALRAKIVEKRLRLGDWERDTMFIEGRKPILVLVDRKSRYTLIAKMKRNTAMSSYVSTKNLLRDKPLKTITNDRGPEFRDEYLLTGVYLYPWERDQHRSAPVYYCDPYAPRQRGTVENTIGLLRQYIPKKANSNNVKFKKLSRIQKQLNLRPRKVLGYRTPFEVMNGKSVALAL
jgi:transposase, IS30 family